VGQKGTDAKQAGLKQKEALRQAEPEGITKEF
jgi:hypothetical protein